MESLEKLAALASGPEEAEETIAVWRCVDGLSRIVECGRRGMTFAIRQDTCKFLLGEKSRKEAELMLCRLEELLYWTIETIRMRYAPPADVNAGAIAGKEARVSRRLFEETVRANRASLRRHPEDGIAATAAFLDFAVTVSQTGEHLMNLMDIAFPPDSGGESAKENTW